MMSLETNFIKDLMTDFDRDWAVCGGWTIDLFLEKQTREHKDIDLFIWRSEQLYAQKYFQERAWQLQKATEGQLIDWQAGEFLELPIHSIWCKHPNHNPDFIELLLNEADETHFIFRRDKSIRCLKGEVIYFSEEGIPYLAPEISLLYKSKNIDENNQHDFDVCVSALNNNQKRWLKFALEKLYGEHVWVGEL